MAPSTPESQSPVQWEKPEVYADLMISSRSSTLVGRDEETKPILHVNYHPIYITHGRIFLMEVRNNKYTLMKSSVLIQPAKLTSESSYCQMMASVTRF